jgi:probable DNA metabolism protein
MGVMNDLLTNDLFPQALLPITLQGQTDLEGFRRAARSLMAQQILPGQVSWDTSSTPAGELLTGAPAAPDAIPTASASVTAAAPTVSVPPEFLALCQNVILHSDPGRFGLMYRILWRLTHEPGLRHDPLDADLLQARQLAQSVSSDMHKMKAFVRFRTVQDETFLSNPEGGLLHVAWFEPEHHIVEAVAPFFARRFAQMRWAILTPECSAEWDGARLRLGPGAQKSDAPPADAGQQLWLTYYQHVFNPARLKRRMRQKDMPRRYWHKPPEAKFISMLATEANQKRMTMTDDLPATPRQHKQELLLI